VVTGSASPPRQLDIFADSRDVMLRNDVVSALTGHDAAAASIHCQTLNAEFPDDASLPALQSLITALQQFQAAAQTPAPNLAAVSLERERLAREYAPAAQQAMGLVAGQAWMLPMWCALAQRCEHLA
jgi:hypothetical protein